MNQARSLLNGDDHPSAALGPSLLLIGLLALLGWLHLGQVIRMPAWEWNGARTAPSVAMTRGLPLYVGPDEGAIASTYYGPVKALLFLPAGLARTPTGAILIAGALNALLLLIPLALVGRFLAHGERRPTWRESWWGLALGAGLLPLVTPTLEMVSNLHVDGPAVGLGLMSCLLLAGGNGPPSSRRQASAALFAVLAVWSKQVEAPLVLAQVVWVAWRWGKAPAVRYLAWTAGLGLAAGAAFVACFGWRAMSFNLLVLPATLPYRRDPATILLAALELAIHCAPFLLLPLLALRTRAHDTRASSAWLRDAPWSLLLLVALFIVPTSMAGRLIVGGHLNSFHSVYYVLAATVAVAVGWCARLTVRLGPVRLHALAALVIMTTALATARLGTRIPFALLESNPFQQAYAIARAYPHQVYFPWQTLSTLMAEGELHHFEYSVGDRVNAGLTPTDAHWRAHLPSDLRYVAYRQTPLGTTALRFLPIDGAPTPIPGWPDWKWYRVADGR